MEPEVPSYAEVTGKKVLTPGEKAREARREHLLGLAAKSIEQIDRDFDKTCQLLIESLKKSDKSFKYYPPLTTDKDANKLILDYSCKKYEKAKFRCKISHDYIKIKIDLYD